MKVCLIALAALLAGCSSVSVGKQPIYVTGTSDTIKLKEK